jgi:dTDP-4-amino-4,6-dideoxygalactose transaminase
MRVERRTEFIRAMKSRGVPASVKHLRIDDNSVLGGVQKGLTNMNRFNKEQVSLPIHPGLSSEDIQFITTAVKKGW